MYGQGLAVCYCGEHAGYFNGSYIIFSFFGIVAGLVFSYPLNRFMLVAYSRRNDKQVPLSWMARYGKGLVGWRGLLLLPLIVGTYLCADFINHTYLVTHPNDKIHRRLGILLHCAAIRGDTGKVRSELKKGADINIKDKYDFTPLHVAARVGQKGVAALLIGKGADLNARDEDGATPLHWATWSGRKEITILLLAKGANVNAKKKDGQTPLHKAKDETIRLLVENDADLNAKAKNGMTPFHHAVCDYEYYNQVTHFIKVGADVNAPFPDGMTPLDKAISLGRCGKGVVDILCAHGAKTGEELKAEKEDR